MAGHGSLYEVPDRVNSRRIGQQLVLFDLQSGTTYALNEVGEAVWMQIEEGRPMAEICDRLAAGYDVSPDVLAADVDALVADLLARGLLAPASAR